MLLEERKFEKQIRRFYRKHFEISHHKAYGRRLLDSDCGLKKLFLQLRSDEKRWYAIQNVLLPTHTQAYISFLSGTSELEVVTRAIRQLHQKADRLCGQGVASVNGLERWFRAHLRETERLRAQENYDTTSDEDEDVLLVLCAAETLKPELFYSKEILRDSTELKTFMKHCIRRGRGFGPEYIAECLELSISEAKRRNIFSNEEMGKLLELSGSSIANLLTGDASPTELGAVARRARYLTRTMRELRDLRRDSQNEYIAAAAEGRLNQFNADHEKIANEFQKAIAKHARLSAKRNRRK